MHKNIGQIFKEFLSFGSPRAVVISFSMIFIIIGIIPTAFWDTAPDFCIWHRFILPMIYNNSCPSTGIFAECHIPSCGLTHALSSLLHGNISDAYSFNHLVYFVLAIMLIVYFKNIYKLFCIK